MKQRLSSLAHAIWQQSELAVVRRVLKIAAAVAVGVTALPIALNIAGRALYHSSNYSQAQQLWRINSVVTWHDKDIPPHNAGTAYYRLSNWAASIEQLERALKRAPEKRQCSVRWNLALALNQRGDESARSQRENDAVGDFTRAASVLDYPSCGDDPAFADMREVISQKLTSLIERINQQNSRPSSTVPPEQESSKTSEEEANERTRRQLEYQNGRNDNRYYDQTDEEKEQGYQNKAW